MRNVVRKDLIVVGCGIAGLYYTLCVSEEKNPPQIALICKDKIEISNSSLAQGGIASFAHDSADSLQDHLTDTISAGCGEVRFEPASKIIAYGARIVEDLARYGIKFDSSDSREHLLGTEGGHSRRRILHIRDQTGYELISALIRLVKRLPNVTIYQDHLAVDLLREDIKIVGLRVLDLRANEERNFFGKLTVLATGGASGIFSPATNRFGTTGDGIAMAEQVGAEILDLEYQQFHPTVLLRSKNRRPLLLSETLRGEGGSLRFPSLYNSLLSSDIGDLNLACRDRLAREIWSENKKNCSDHIYFDMSNVDSNFLKKRFPYLNRKLAEEGYDLSKDLIPVTYAAHYSCGGIAVTSSGETGLPGLRAIGEVACTGLHGANRLASNSLLECFAMAFWAAEEGVDQSCNSDKFNQFSDLETRIWGRGSDLLPREFKLLRNARERKMYHLAGPIRSQIGLEELNKIVEKEERILEEFSCRNQPTRENVEGRNSARVAFLLCRSALGNSRSAGCHFLAEADRPDQYSQD